MIWGWGRGDDDNVMAMKDEVMATWKVMVLRWRCNDNTMGWWHYNRMAKPFYDDDIIMPPPSLLIFRWRCHHLIAINSSSSSMPKASQEKKMMAGRLHGTCHYCRAISICHQFNINHDLSWFDVEWLANGDGHANLQQNTSMTCKMHHHLVLRWNTSICMTIPLLAGITCNNPFFVELILLRKIVHMRRKNWHLQVESTLKRWFEMVMHFPSLCQPSPSPPLLTRTR